MKKFLDFRIYFVPFLPDIVAGALWELNINGIGEDDSFIDVYTEEDSNVTAEDVSRVLKKLKAENLIESFEIATFKLEDKNWNAEWEKNIKVIKVSDKLVIKPTFKDYSPLPDETVIEIDPKMSFGTGEHETTRLALRLLEKYVLPDAKVLDVGSGTAVLSIYSALLGAESVLAVDNNDWCYQNGVENVRRNSVSEKVKVLLGEIYDVNENDFDLVIANINKNVLLEIKDELTAKVKDGGRLILSGVLLTDAEQMKTTYSEKGMTPLEILTENEWIAMVFEKNI